MTTTTDDTVNLEQLAVEYTKLDAEAEAIKERKETIKAILLGRFSTGSHTVGPFKVTVKAGSRRLSTSRITAAYPVAQHPELYKPAIDTAAVKQHIAPVDLEAFQDAGAPTVQVG